MAKSFVIGADEVGRGALAGPVTVAVALVPKELRIRNYELGILRDSKKLTARQREEWFKFFRNHSQIKYAVAKVHPRNIEKINISRAANLAAFRAYRRLTSIIHHRSSNISIYLDGGLYLKNKDISHCYHAKTVIKGDEKISAIQIASILAKVSRDRMMRRLSKRYPRYGFEIHKGYGTKIHLAALKRFGPSEIHRLTFLRFLQNSKR